MTQDPSRFHTNSQHPNFEFLEITQDYKVAEVCAQWPMLAEVFSGAETASADSEAAHDTTGIAEDSMPVDEPVA